MISTPSIAWVALLPILILFAGSVLLLTISSLVRKRLFPGFYALFTVVVTLAAAVAVLPTWARVQGWSQLGWVELTHPAGIGPFSTLAGAIGVDGFGLFVTVVICSAVLVGALVADSYLRREGLDGAELRKYLTEEIARHVAAETRRATGEVDPRRALSEMGLDSVMSSRVRHALQRQFGIALPVTLFWDRPTIDAVAEWLIECLRAAEADRRDEGANVS